VCVCVCVCEHYTQLPGKLYVTSVIVTLSIQLATFKISIRI